MAIMPEKRPKKQRLNKARRRAAPASEAAVEARQVLVAATIDLMREKADVDLSVAEIGARAGMNSAMIGYYFESKTDLFGQVSAECLSGATRDVIALRDASLPNEEKLRKFVIIVMALFYQFPFMERLFHYLLIKGREDLAHGFANQEFVNISTDFLSNLIEEGNSQGVFSSVHSMVLYFHIINSSARIFSSKMTFQRILGVERVDQPFFDFLADHSAELILNGVKAR